jgi:hypothetical protein
MGNLEIVLPPNLSIDVDVSSFAGNVTERHRMPPEDDPARPQLRITGTVRFGNLEITTRLPGESATAAHRRERHARKQLRRAERRERWQERLEDRRERRALRSGRDPGRDKLLPPGDGS